MSVDHDIKRYRDARKRNTAPRSQLLADADELINGDRNAQYGPPTQDFTRTAAMWAAYLGTPIAPHDVAALMALLKLSRIAWSPEKHDHWADLAGYAACGWECAEGETGGDES